MGPVPRRAGYLSDGHGLVIQVVCRASVRSFGVTEQPPSSAVDDNRSPLSEYPKPSAVDYGHHVLRAALQLVPVVGGPAAEVFEMVIPTALEKRKKLWSELLDERLRRVERQIDDEEFATLVIQATKAALGTHLEEKIRLLAEVVAVGAAATVDDVMAGRHLQHVEALAPAHFQVLRLLKPPDQVIVHRTVARPGHAAGRPATPVRCWYAWTHAPGAAAWAHRSPPAGS